MKVRFSISTQKSGRKYTTFTARVGSRTSSFSTTDPAYWAAYAPEILRQDFEKKGIVIDVAPLISRVQTRFYSKTEGGA